MANVMATEATHARHTVLASSGNLSRLQLPMETNANGVLIGSSKKTALAIGDIVRLLRMPKGTLIGLGTDIPISDAFTAGTTIQVGFEYADGVNDADFPQDAAFFHAAGSTAAVARLNTTPVRKPRILPKDAWVIATIAGANHAAAGRLDILLDVEYQGIRGME